MKRQRPTLEPLEPRILYSADTPSALAAALVGMPDAEHRLLDAEGEFAVQNEPAEIVFIDARTPDAAQLVEDIAAQSERQVEVVVLDAERNGLEQINEALAGRENVAALHFIAHGGEGVMQLGNTLVTADALERNPSLVEAWSKALGADADILLYGCDIAATAQGRLLADTLARLTGADVSASDDATGHASLGGDWDLEFQSGRVETEVVFSEEFRSQWLRLLPTYESFTNHTSELEIRSDANHGQTFAHNSGNGTYTANQISLALRRDAAAVAQTLTVTLQDGWNGTILGSATISSASLGTSLAFHDLSIGNVTLNDNQVYTIRVTTDTTAGQVYAGFNSSGGYGGGNRIDSSGSPLAGEDVAFKIGNTTLGYEPPFTDLPDNAYEIVGGSNPLWGQTFSHNSGAGTYTLYQIELVLYQDGSANPSSDFEVKLRATWDGADIASTTVSHTSLGTSEAWVSVTLSAPVTLTDNTLYFIRLDGAGSGRIFVGVDDIGTYAEGTFINDGVAEVLKDMAFRLVEATNAAPAVDLNAGGAGQDVTVAFAEQTAVLVAPAGTLADVDSANLTSLTLTLTARPDGNAVESLSLNAAATAAASGAGLTVSYTAASGVLSITGSASVATYQTILQGVQYSNTSDTPTASNRSVSVVANDGALSSAVATSTITVAAVNDAPVANADSYTIAEDTTLDTDALWFDAAWSYRRALSFDNTAQTENLTDFPVLIALDASRIDYAQTQNNGQDLRFVDGNGTLLAHEIETWNESGTSYVWVKVPQVDGGSGSDFIWMYYGNAAAPDGENAPAVWSNNFQAVYHLNDNTGASGSIGDSTGVFNATNVGTTAVGGYIGGAHAFNGINQRVNLGANQPYLNNASGATISAWVNAASTVQEIIFATEVGSATGFSRATLDLVGNRITLIGRSTDFELGRELQSAPGLISTGTWHYLTGVIDYAGDTLTIYVDGVQVASASGVGFAASATPGTNSARASMGSNEDGTTGRYNGILDEVSLADSVRTADWIAAQYASTSDAFVTYGSEQSAGVLRNDTDVDSALLTAVLVSAPGNAASFSLNADGSFTYLPAADFNGVDSFTYKANDGTADSAVATVTITVTPVNDAPSATITAATFTATEQTSLSLVAGGLSVADVDGPGVTATLSVGQGVLNVTAGTTGAAVANSGTGTVTISGTQAQINALLAGAGGATLAYFNASDTPSASTTLTLGVSDGTLSASDSATINISAVNDAPVLAGAGGTLAYTEGAAATLIDATLTVGDVDDVNIESATVTISAGLVSAEDVLGFTPAFGITGSYTAATGVLALSGSATRAQYESVLESVTYQNTNTGNPSTGARTVTWVVNDGADNSAGVTSTVTLAAVNDAPVLSGANNLATIGEDPAVNGGTLVSALIAGQVADADTGALSGIAVTAVVNTNGTWEYSTNGGLAWSAFGNPSGNNSRLLAADANTYVRFVPNANFNGTVSNGITFRAWDQMSGTAGLTANTNTNGGATAFSSATASASITVTAVNDAPSATITAATFAASEQTALSLVAGGLSVADVDGPGVTATLAVGEGVLTVTAGATGATVANSGTATVTISGTQAQINALLAGAGGATLAYTNGSDTPSASTTLTLTASDGTLSASDTATINITAVNDAPSATITAATFAASEQAALSLVAGGLSVADVDGPGVTATLAVGEGVLTVTAGATGATVANSGTATVTISGTQAQINALLAGAGGATLAYTNGSDTPSASTTLTLTASDGTLSASDTATINITALNDAPVNGAPGAQSTNEDTALVFSAGNGNAISVGDVDAGTSPVQVVLTGANGAITLAGIAGLTFSVGDGVADAAMTFSGTVGAINAALNGLSFMPTANFSGAASLSISTDDQGNTGTGGALSDADAVPITVLPNVAPTVSASGGTTVFTEGGNVASTPVILDGAVTVSDPDSTTLASATISIGAGWQAAEDVLGFASNPATMGNIAGSYNAATGVLSMGSAGATATLAEWQAALRSLIYTNTSDMPSTAARTVSFVVNGQGGSSAASVQQVAVVAVNDAPTLSASGGTTAFTGGGAAVVVDTALAVSDVDNVTLAAATVSIGGGFQPGQDVLDFSSDPATMGNITGSYNAASGVLNLSSAGATATLAQWQAALRSVSYDNTAATPVIGVRSVSIAVSDGNSSGPVASHTVIVNPAPVVPEPPAPPPVVPPVIPPVVIGPPPVTPPPAPAPQPAPSTAPGRPSAAVAEESGETSTLVADMNATAAPASVGQHVTPAADAGVPATRFVSFVAAQSVLAAEAESELLAGVLVRQADTRPMNLFQLDERGRTALEEGLGSELAQLRESLREQDEIQQRTVVTLAAGSLSMTLAYLLWLIRGGALVASALSALPAWRLLDPLPILSRVDDEDEEEAGEDEDQAIASFADEPVGTRR